MELKDISNLFDIYEEFIDTCEKYGYKCSIENIFPDKVVDSMTGLNVHYSKDIVVAFRLDRLT